MPLYIFQTPMNCNFSNCPNVYHPKNIVLLTLLKSDKLPVHSWVLFKIRVILESRYHKVFNGYRTY